MNGDPRGRGDSGARSPGILSAHRPDIYVAAVVLAVSAALFARTFWFDQVPSSLAQNVQPAVFPRLILVTIAIIALIIPFEFHRKLRAGIDLDSNRREPIGRSVPITAGALIAMVAALPWLGALPALLLIAGGLPILWGERRWKILLPYIVLFPLSVLWLFSEVLQVTFPRGFFANFLF